MEDETASFAGFFPDHGARTVAEVVLPLHDEALHHLSEIASAHGFVGSTELTRSAALQIALNHFIEFCRQKGDHASEQFHLSGGEFKDRSVLLFEDTMVQLGELEGKYRHSETILAETAIRMALVAIPSQRVALAAAG